MAKCINEKEKWVSRAQVQQPPSLIDGPALSAADLDSELNNLWRQHTHDELLWELQNTCWLPLVCQIHQLVLHHLEVNVQNCYCPCGCRREISWALGWLCEWANLPPNVLVVGGTRSEGEREEISLICGKSIEAGMKLEFGRYLDC